MNEVFAATQKAKNMGMEDTNENFGGNNRRIRDNGKCQLHRVLAIPPAANSLAKVNLIPMGASLVAN